MIMLNISEEMKQWIDDQVASGRFSCHNEYIIHLLELDQKHQKQGDLTPEDIVHQQQETY